jgi:hypothetical protein
MPGNSADALGIEQPQNYRRLAAFVISTLCGFMQSPKHICFGNTFNVLIAWKGFLVQCASIKHSEGSTIGKEPRFHALNHPAYVVLRLGSAGDSPVGLTAKAGLKLAIVGLLAVHQENEEIRTGMAELSTEIVDRLIAATSSHQPKLSASSRNGLFEELA